MSVLEMELFWILIFSFVNGMRAEDIHKKPMFYALDNPCMDQYRLCSTACSVITLKKDVHCQFCYCNDSNNNIAWPSTKTPTSKIPTTRRGPPPSSRPSIHVMSTTHSPYLIVNNIAYVTLMNPCVPTKAMCPVKCKMSNITVQNRICETCNCEDIFSKGLEYHAYFGNGILYKLVQKHILCNCEDILTQGFGKRSEDQKIEVSLQRQDQISESGTKYTKTKRKNLLNRCGPFFCPLVRCPNGQYFEIGPDGCQMCRCSIAQNSEKSMVTKTKSSKLNHQSGTKPDVSKLFCMPTPDYCPSNCHVQNITVDFWHCYFCRCPQDMRFVAMVNPCNAKTHLCPSNCSVRHLQSSVILGSIPCDYCDCKTKKTDLERNSRMAMNSFKIGDISTSVHCLNLASDCPSHCHLTSVHSYSWKCHVCVCKGVLIPKEFIHHLHTVPTQLATPSQFTNEHMKSMMATTVLVTHNNKLLSSSSSTQTVKVPDPLPTSDKALSPDKSSYLHSISFLSTTYSPEVSISCFICNETRCGDTDLQLCSKDTMYCMNNFIQYPDRTKEITRGCVTEDECNRKWWLKTADDPVCLSLDHDANIETDEVKECSFCCTNNGCNKSLKMKDHIFIGNQK